MFPCPETDCLLAVLYPETARKTLEELDFIFIKAGDRPARMEQEVVEMDRKLRANGEHLEAV